jgi:undecaprenyl-diphosphatase
MTLLQALLLGALQGLTEFLPVSSSGHLVLLQHFFGLREPALLFDILVHVATLFAVFVVYRRDIWELLLAVPGLSTAFSQYVPGCDTDRAATRRLGLLLLLANVPTALMGVAFADTFEHLFATPWAVGVALLMTGSALWSLRYVSGNHDGLHDIRVWQALALGVVQGLAITPGISRSGSTIAVALWCGLQRESAARFSFLMAIPPILGAMLLKSSVLSTLSEDQIGLLVGGMISALVVGYIALRFLLRLLMHGNFWRFALYCWFLGVGTILLVTL